MKTCEVCKTDSADEAETCPACGEASFVKVADRQDDSETRVPRREKRTR